MNNQKNILIDGSEGKKIALDIFWKNDNIAKPILIFVHGFKGFKDWGCWNLLAEKFAESGFVFIKFNFSHNGTTPENPLEFDDLEAFGKNNFSKELFDLDKVLEFTNKAILDILKNQINNDEIYLMGHSRGAGICILKAKEDKKIKKMVLLAAQTDFSSYFSDDLAEWQKKGVKHILNGRTFQEMPLYWQFAEDYFSNEDKYQPQKVAFELEIPVLFIYGTEDKIIKPLIFSNLYLHHTSKKSIFVENSDHVFNITHPYKLNELTEPMQKVFCLTIEALKN